MSGEGLIGKLVRYSRKDGLADAVRRRLGIPPVQGKVRWFGAETEDEAARGLAVFAKHYCERGGAGAWVANLGDGGTLQTALDEQLRRGGVASRRLGLDAVLALPAAEQASLAGVLCAYTNSRDIGRAGAVLMGHPTLAQKPFEYAAGLDPERRIFQRLDEYRETYFQSPVLHDSIPVYAIYEESLQHFEQKCGLRDYLDLYQLLRHIHLHRVPGAVCEFGSFRGHSGWLIARLLQALGSDKKLYLFDMFEKFPQELYGVDAFWSDTHRVDFEQVKSKFVGMSHVSFVQGDFTQTLATSGVERIALAYIDCDSYRATRTLVDQIYESRLSSNGLLVFEDYGHPALLGNRIAVNQSVREAKLGFQFFSQFSGLYVTLKTTGTP